MRNGRKTEQQAHRERSRRQRRAAELPASWSPARRPPSVPPLESRVAPARSGQRDRRQRAPRDASRTRRSARTAGRSRAPRSGSAHRSGYPRRRRRSPSASGASPVNCTCRPIAWLPGEIPTGERLVDDDDARCVAVVGRAEQPAVQQLDAHDREIIFADRAKRKAELTGCRLRPRSRPGPPCRPLVAGQRQAPHKCRPRNTRHRGNALQDVLVERLDGGPRPDTVVTVIARMLSTS